MSYKPKLLIIFSALLILSGFGSLLAFMLRFSPRVQGTYAPWDTPVIALLYIAAGLGSLKLKNWARHLILGFSIFFLVKTSYSVILWFNRFGSSAGSEAKAGILISGLITAAVYSAAVFYYGIKIKRLFVKSQGSD